MNSMTRFYIAMNCSLVQDLNVKNEELTSEMQKLRTLLSSGMSQRQRETSQHVDDGGQGQCGHGLCNRHGQL